MFMHLLLTQQVLSDFFFVDLFTSYLFHGKAPFWADSNEQLFVLIREGEIPDFKKYHLSDEADAFLSEVCLNSYILWRPLTCVHTSFLVHEVAGEKPS